MIDASPLVSALMDDLQSGGSRHAQSGGRGLGQSLETRLVVTKLSRGFQPLSCTAESYDFETQLRYRVFAPCGMALVNVHGIALSTLFAREALDAEIEKTRAELEHQGLVLRTRQS